MLKCNLTSLPGTLVVSRHVPIEGEEGERSLTDTRDQNKPIAITTMAPAPYVPTIALNLERFEYIQRREGTWEKDDKLENILKKAAAVPLISTSLASSSLRNANQERGGKNVQK
jgi:hypothetical protein